MYRVWIKGSGYRRPEARWRHHLALRLPTVPNGSYLMHVNWSMSWDPSIASYSHFPDAQ